MNGNEIPLDGDEKHVADIQQMNALELLCEVVRNPEYLTDRYYRVFGNAIQERFEELCKELCKERGE